MKQPGSHQYLPRSVVTAQGRIFAAFLVFSLGVAHGDELALQAGVTTALQNSDDSRVETELTASADLVLTLPRRTGVGDGGAQVSPSIQYVENPGFDASGPTFSSSSVVASVRFHWSFEK
jgi:hypothetical protein